MGVFISLHKVGAFLKNDIPSQEEVSLATLEFEESSQKREKKKDFPEKKAAYPEELEVVPLNRRPFFPGMAAPLVIEPGGYYEVLKRVAKTSHKCLGLFLTKEESADIYKLKEEDLSSVGVVAKILRIIPLEGGGAQVVLNMEKRAVIQKTAQVGGLLKAKVVYHEEPLSENTSKEVKAYSISIVTTIKELLKLNPLFKEELQVFLGHSDFTEPGKLADFAVALTTASREELQDVLETLSLQERIDKALLLLKKELDLSRLQNNINQRIEVTISKAQRDFFLKEQLKVIKKELGMEKEDKLLDVEKFRKRLKEKTVPEAASKVIEEEMEKLQALDPHSAEYSVCRNYLDWLTVLPWGIFEKEDNSFSEAEKILEEDHYGLKEVKERILEFIGVGKLTQGVKGSILCLVGPPGVGKTSVGKSVARALNRKFYRFSVGGMKDEGEVKGHRRTYIGAMPGKLIQALKVTASMNPVVMIDEIDKIGKAAYQGDPASALLEVLDPEQNKEFLDHYLDVPCDLSRVLFIVTANVLDTIPEPLKDRMEIIRLSGYIASEKLEIARKYLIPKNRKGMGLKNNQIVFASSGVSQMIQNYAREAGVRSLENQIKKVLRKVAVKVAKAKEGKQPFTKEHITSEKLEGYLGKPFFTSDRFYEKTPIGVTTGLAWTALGGATLYVEASASKGEKALMKLTGQAGDIMKESSQIAWSYAKAVSEKFFPNVPFFEKQEVHIHIPEGATPKDGPSAGVTMVTSLFSLLGKRPVTQDLGMTGEITLTGRVLKIGGVKEKVIAARRSFLKELIFPKENKRDFEELPPYLKKDLVVHFVETYEEVFSLIFSERSRKVSSKRRAYEPKLGEKKPRKNTRKRKTTGSDRRDS